MELESIEDLITNPSSQILNMVNEDEAIVHRLSDVGQYFRSKLGDQLSKIPCINDVCMENIPSNSLVCFRGMIQDMLDPEFYLGRYSVTNKLSKEISRRTGCFNEIAKNQNEEIDFDCNSNVTLERQTFICVPVPGENTWLKDMYVNNSSYVDINSVTANKSKKRVHVSDNILQSTMDVDDSMSPSIVKKLKGSNGAQCGPDVVKNAVNDLKKCYPLPNENGTSCFMKIYANSSDLKLNDVVEFYGILIKDSPHNVGGGDAENEEMPPYEDETEELSYSYFGVPSIHCIFFNKLPSSNPGIIKKSELYENTLKELTSVRNDLVQLLTNMFGGDATAAEYFLIHLISNTYAIVGTLCVGKFSLNITKCSKQFPQTLYDFMKKVVEKSYLFPLTVDNLNQMKFTPKKDYEANQLVSGILQLSSGTNLVLDETAMEPGKLDSDGVNNLKAIGNLIQWQNVEYNFMFNKLDMRTDVNVLIFSEGRSMLKCDCQIPISSEKVDADAAKLLVDNVNPVLLEKIRIYLSCIRTFEFNLTEEVSKALEEDFVEMRKQDSTTMTAEAFSLLLTTARYMALSYGQNTLDAPLWTRAKALDEERKKRSF